MWAEMPQLPKDQLNARLGGLNCTTCDTLAEDDVIFGEGLREETPPPDDYMEEGEEAEEFGFVELEGKNEIDCF